MLSSKTWNAFKTQLPFFTAGHVQSVWSPGPKLPFRFLHLLFVCASALITCTIITLHTLLPCMWLYFSQLGGCFEYSGCSYYEYSLAQLRVWNTVKQRQCRFDGTRLTKSRMPEARTTHNAYKLANRLKMTARRALAPMNGCLGMKYHTCFWVI